MRPDPHSPKAVKSAPKAVGPNAGVIKYDILTALGSYGCQGDKHLQRLTLRFMTLIVARYNWQSNELTVGQREIAQMWGVDERTVKRDLARLRELGWLEIKRAAARGRVATHRLNMEAILHATQGTWAAVGPDFASRMSPQEQPPETNVIPFPPSAPELPQGEDAWSLALRDLHEQSPQLCQAWFLALRPYVEGDVWQLIAPSRFHATFVSTHHFARLERALRKYCHELKSLSILS